MDKAAARDHPRRSEQEERRMGKVMAAFYGNAVVYMVAVAALGALCVFLGQGSIAAFLFMVLGMMIVLWDAHTDPHIPEAPSIT